METINTAPNLIMVCDPIRSGIEFETLFINGFVSNGL